MNEEFSEYIKLYRTWGFSFIPVYPRTKRPCIKWESFKERPPSEADIRRWLRTYWNPEYWKELAPKVGEAVRVYARVSPDYSDEDARWNAVEARVEPTEAVRWARALFEDLTSFNPTLV